VKLTEVAVPDKIQELSRMEGLRGCTTGCHMAQPGVARISPGDLDPQAKGGSGRVAALNRSPFMGLSVPGGEFLPPTLPILLALDSKHCYSIILMLHLFNNVIV
jgi:hypothetical protein